MISVNLYFTKKKEGEVIFKTTGQTLSLCYSASKSSEPGVFNLKEYFFSEWWLELHTVSPFSQGQGLYLILKTQEVTGCLNNGMTSLLLFFNSYFNE